MANKEANSGTAPGGNYDVFLSFRGLDTRNTFTDCLYVFLKIRGIRVYRDDEELQSGEKISKILGAVENSRIYIPIFSKNYAESKWCLRELKCMVESHGRSPEKQILPIFYDVEPRDVKLKTEVYKSALTKHEEDPSCTEVKQWKKALTTVARIKGWHIKDKRQGEVIENIVKDVLLKINTTKRDLPAHLVGIDDRIEDIKRLLNYYYTSDVRSVIIHGIGGMGKTTLANAVFNQLSPQFEGHSFLSNIQDLGIEKLQKKLLADLFQFLLPETFDCQERNNLIRKMLPNKQVLLVFDGMDENDQSMQLAKYCTLCGPGSRIIITTTSKSVFSMIKVEGFEENISTRSTKIIPYEMKGMHLDHALQLFNKLAFNTYSAPPDLYDLSKEVVEFTGGLPLAVEVIGSHLHGQSKAQWISTLDQLKKVPHKKVQQRLKISYDALAYRQQQIFLDIACFFVNKKITIPMYMWEDSGFRPRFEIEVLIGKSLIKIVDHDRIWMHDQLKAFGREIVRQEHMTKPEDRSRFWFLERAHEKGIENAVALTPRRLEDNFTCKDFVGLTNARFLKLDGENFAGNFEDILLELRWLCWQNCPPELQANNFVLNHLVVLKLSGDNITDKWSGWIKIMVASKLKVLKIARSNSLIRTPCFLEFMSLERLVLKGFPNLIQIDPSIGRLERLIYLKIKWCPCLRELPHQIGYLTTLRELILIQGFSIRHLPESIGNLRFLSRLVVEDTGLVELPSAIKGLADLEYLCLANCTSLNSLSDAVGELKSLTELDLSGTTIKELPHSIYNLKCLTLRINSSKIRARLMRDSPPLEGIEDCFDSVRLGADWESEPKNLKEAHLENVRQEFWWELSILVYSMMIHVSSEDNSMREVPLEKVRQKSMNEVHLEKVRQKPLEKVRQKSMNEVPFQKVQKKLMSTYKELEYGEKQIFLDIASIFSSKKKTDALYIRKGCVLFPKVKIDALVSKSLIKILDHDKVWMHDWVMDFGRKIIHEENIEISFEHGRFRYLILVNEMEGTVNHMLGAILMVILNLANLLVASEEFDSWDAATKEDWRNSEMLLFCVSISIIMLSLSEVRSTCKRDYRKAKVMSMRVMARLIIFPSAYSICVLGRELWDNGKLLSLGETTYSLAAGVFLRIIITDTIVSNVAYFFQTLVDRLPLLLAWSRLY